MTPATREHEELLNQVAEGLNQATTALRRLASVTTKAKAAFEALQEASELAGDAHISIIEEGL